MVIEAGSQHAGQGSRGRSWESPENAGLFMSMILRPELLPEKASMITLVAAYAAAAVLREEYDLDVRIKWPNDLVLSRKKAAGILTQMQMKDGKIDFIICGIGVNVSSRSFSPELSDKATSLYQETGRDFDREALMAHILNRFEKEYECFVREADLHFMKEEYERLLINRGCQIRIEGEGSEWTGAALGITDRGELLVQDRWNKIRTIASGEVSVRGLYSYV